MWPWWMWLVVGVLALMVYPVIGAVRERRGGGRR